MVAIPLITTFVPRTIMVPLLIFEEETKPPDISGDRVALIVTNSFCTVGVTCPFRSAVTPIMTIEIASIFFIVIYLFFMRLFYMKFLPSGEHVADEHALPGIGVNADVKICAVVGNLAHSAGVIAVRWRGGEGEWRSVTGE